MRNVVITETELELIYDVLNDWFRMANRIMPDCKWHTVYGLMQSLPQCNKDMVFTDDCI